MVLGKFREDTFEIPYDVRMNNIAFFGSKASGRSSHFLPMLANDQFDRRDEGALFIVENSHISWLLYALAKKYHREVVFLSPSCNDAMKDLVDIGISNVRDVEKLIDFKEVLEQKKIVIVDAEPYRYQQRAIDLVAALLMDLQGIMYLNTHDTPFFVYVEDGDLYLPYMKDLITYGGQFGIGSTLFFQGRALMQAQSPVLSYFVEANMRTTILMNALIFDDIKYFKERFYGEAEDDSVLMSRKRNHLLIETISKEGERQVAYVDVRFLVPGMLREIEEEASQLREKQKNHDSFSYSVAKEVTIATKEKKKQQPQPPLHPNKLSPSTNKIFISEDDLFR